MLNQKHYLSWSIILILFSSDAWAEDIGVLAEYDGLLRPILTVRANEETLRMGWVIESQVSLVFTNTDAGTKLLNALGGERGKEWVKPADPIRVGSVQPTILSLQLYQCQKTSKSAIDPELIAGALSFNSLSRQPIVLDRGRRVIHIGDINRAHYKSDKVLKLCRSSTGEVGAIISYADDDWFFPLTTITRAQATICPSMFQETLLQNDRSRTDKSINVSIDNFPNLAEILEPSCEIRVGESNSLSVCNLAAELIEIDSVKQTLTLWSRR